MTNQDQPSEGKQKKLNVPQPKGIPEPNETKPQVLSSAQMINKILTSLSKRGQLGLIFSIEEEQILDSLQENPESTLALFLKKYDGKLSKEQFSTQYQLKAMIWALELLKRKAPPKPPLWLRVSCYLATLAFGIFIGSLLIQSLNQKLEARLSSEQKKVASLKESAADKTEESQKQLEALKSKLASALEGVDTKQSQKVGKNADNALLDIAFLQAQLAEEEKNSKTNRMTIANLQSLVQEQKATINEASFGKDASAKKIKELADKLATNQNELSSAQAEIASLKEELRSTSARWEQLVSKNAELTEEVSGLMKESDLAKTAYSSKMLELTSTQEKMFKESQAFKLALEKEIETLNTELESRENKNQQELQSLRTKYQATREAEQLKYNELENKNKLAVRKKDVAYRLLQLVTNRYSNSVTWENFSEKDAKEMSAGLKFLNGLSEAKNNKE